MNLDASYLPHHKPDGNDTIKTKLIRFVATTTSEPNSIIENGQLKLDEY